MVICRYGAGSPPIGARAPRAHTFPVAPVAPGLLGPRVPARGALRGASGPFRGAGLWVPNVIRRQ